MSNLSSNSSTSRFFRSTIPKIDFDDGDYYYLPSSISIPKLRIISWTPTKIILLDIYGSRNHTCIIHHHDDDDDDDDACDH